MRDDPGARRGERPMTLAIVSPLPGAPTGIADYTANVVRVLSPHHEIELFHAGTFGPSEVNGAPLFAIEELTRRSADAVLYQMGNGPAHDFMYEWMPRIPGAVVLHDLVLHHAFARRYLRSEAALAYEADPANREKRALAEASQRAYLAEIESVAPGLGERLKDAFLNTSGSLLPYAFPLFEPALRGAIAGAAHNDFMVDAIQAACPRLPVTRLTMPAPKASFDSSSIAAFRRRFGLGAGRPIVGCFGYATPEKKIETVARAVARLKPHHRGVTLLVAGSVADPSWLTALVGRLGLESNVVVTGFLETSDFAAAIGACDVVAHLRYPTARETSAALLQVMALARPAVISDIANQSEIPQDVVLRVDPVDEEGGLARSLDWALRDPERSERMGKRAAVHVRTVHSDENVRAGYERLLKSVADNYPQRFPE